MTTNTNLVGYARIAGERGDLRRQVDALLTAGCERVFAEVASGARDDRAGLAAALESLLEGDILVVCRADRLSRSTDHFAAIFTALEDRGAGFRTLSRGAGTSWPRQQAMTRLLAWGAATS